MDARGDGVHERHAKAARLGLAAHLVRAANGGLVAAHVHEERRLLAGRCEDVWPQVQRPHEAGVLNTAGPRVRPPAPSELLVLRQKAPTQPVAVRGGCRTRGHRIGSVDVDLVRARSR